MLDQAVVIKFFSHGQHCNHEIFRYGQCLTRGDYWLTLPYSHFGDKDDQLADA